jgi:hypothetical protein
MPADPRDEQRGETALDKALRCFASDGVAIRDLDPDTLESARAELVDLRCYMNPDEAHRYRAAYPAKGEHSTW